MVQFDITSDIHIDMYPKFLAAYGYDRSVFNPDGTLKYKQLWEWFTPKSEHLIIAGDVGHVNKENIQFFKDLREHYYKTICFVTGNHDYYTCNEYKGDSFLRVSDMAKEVAKIPGVYFLNGTVADIEGVKVGGSMGWYDGSYTPEEYPIMFPTHRGDKIAYHTDALWKMCMNDANYINISRFDALFKCEYDKLVHTVEKADIMVTHINPSNLAKHQNPVYVKEPSSTFYCFDGSKLLKKTTAKYWLYGHTHSSKMYIKNKVKHICNPAGYPWESADYQLKQIEVKV